MTAKVEMSTLPVRGRARYKTCSCCPYGYHIDVDFVRFCEAMTTPRRRPRRRHRHSMDVMLGLAEPDADGNGDELSHAVQVFEDTLQRSSEKSSSPPMQLRSPAETATAGTLQNVREQIAASLLRIRELEGQVELISVLQEEKRTLLEQLRQYREREAGRKTCDRGVCCVVMTRDVGVGRQRPRSRSVATATDCVLFGLDLRTDAVRRLVDAVCADACDHRDVEARLREAVAREFEDSVAAQVERRYAAELHGKLSREFEDRLTRELERRVARELDSRVAREFEDRVTREVERRVALQVDDKVRREFEERLARELEKRAAVEIDAKVRREFEERVARELEKRAAVEIDGKVRREFEERVARELEKRAAVEIDAKVRREFEERVARELEKRAAVEINEKVRREFEERVALELEKRAAVEIDKKVSREFEDRVARELEKRAAIEIDEKVRLEIEDRVARELEKRAAVEIDEKVHREFEERVARELERRVPSEIDRKLTREIEAGVAKEMERRYALELRDKIALEFEDRVAAEVERRVALEVDDKVNREFDDRVARELDRRYSLELADKVRREFEERLARELDRRYALEMAEKLSREFDARVAEELDRKFTLELDDKIIGEFEARVAHEVERRLVRKFSDERKRLCDAGVQTAYFQRGSRTVASQVERARSRDATLQTELKRKEVATNTPKRKFVDASVGGAVACVNGNGNEAGVSRIPRPTTSPLPARKHIPPAPAPSPSPAKANVNVCKEPPRLVRQNTHTIIVDTTRTNEQRVEPSKEMKAALKVINDSLTKSPKKKEFSHNLSNAANIVQQEWFKVSGGKTVNPLAVEDYLDYIERYSSALLEYVVNMTDMSGNTALHYAVSSGNFDVVSILLDSKVCDINKTNAAGYTCVMLATLVKLRNETHRQIIRRMFHLADVNMKAKPHGQTALMLATSHGSLEMVEMLTEAGADMNIQDADGSTALMCAADHGYTDIVKHIIAQPDCDVSLVDSDGSTALNIAMEAGNRHIGLLLYAHEHCSRGNSPHGSLKQKSRSSTPRSTTPRRTSASPVAVREDTDKHNL